MAIWGTHLTQAGHFTFGPKDEPSAFFPEADGLCAVMLGAIYAVFPKFGISTAEADVLRVELSVIRVDMGLND